MEVDLAGRVTLVTGGSKGIGLAAVRGLLVEGGPGPVRTAWWTDDGGAADILAAHAASDRHTVLDELGSRDDAAAHRPFDSPNEIADAILLLVSPRSGSTTGTEFIVDGGLVKAA
jgi:NAD(P)-dependent dehydrogenase (short-subunit alcohol dehydrogenase family)